MRANDAVNAGCVRLMAVDLDGTLLTRQGALADGGVLALRQASQLGVYVILATTRNVRDVVEIALEIGLIDPIICANGARVLGAPDGPEWACHTIPLRAAVPIAEMADANGWELSITAGEVTTLRQRPGQSLGVLRRGVVVTASNAAGVTIAPVRILAWSPDAIQALSRLCSSLADVCRTETYLRTDGSVHSLGIFAAQADKGSALALVCQRLGISQNGVMAIGDNLNDLPMFALARVSVAMGNSPDVVKNNATAVAPSNDEEGVAWAVHRFALSSG